MCKEVIKRQRIRIALFAYAYEYKDDSLISDSEYDNLSREVDASREIITDNEVCDSFFRDKFSADTGMWVREHPGIHSGELCALYLRYKQLGLR